MTGTRRNISVFDHLKTLFVDNWSINVNFSIYFHECEPSSCTYSMVEKTNFLGALALLISLYGGLIIIFRLFTPALVDMLWKIKHSSWNSIRMNSGIF